MSQPDQWGLFHDRIHKEIGPVRPGRSVKAMSQKTLREILAKYVPGTGIVIANDGDLEAAVLAWHRAALTQYALSPEDLAWLHLGLGWAQSEGACTAEELAGVRQKLAAIAVRRREPSGN